MNSGIVLVLILVCALTAEVRQQKLQFNADGTFTILQLTDLHYGEADDLDKNTTNLMRRLLSAEKPDFLAFTGDMVAGYSWDKKPGWYKKMWDRWTEVIFETQIPYGYTLGNHDSEADLKRREIVEVDMKSPYSFTRLAPEDLPGASTFVIPVYSSKNSDEVVMNLWFFDSEDYDCLGVKGYGCVDVPTVAWYREMSKKLEKEQGGKKPGIAFMHIPPQEYMYAYDHYMGVGNKTEGSGCSSINTGLIAAFKERGDMKAMFAGHDHSNDFVIDFEGILLGYGRKTGYGCYGPPPGMQRGGRVLKFTEKDFDMTSWIIQEDLTRDFQKPEEVHFTPQDVCNGSKPPK